jgi:hypothetical protein
MNKLLDKYIKRPLLYDVAFIMFLILLNEYLVGLKKVVLALDKNILGNLLNELVSSSVSIGGFVIAALTIILTLKDNLKAKEGSFPISALEIIFNSKHYKRVVRVFYWASLIFVITFFYFSVLEVLWPNFSEKMAMYLIMIGLWITVMAVIRCLLILQAIIEIQLKDKSTAN